MRSLIAGTATLQTGTLGEKCRDKGHSSWVSGVRSPAICGTRQHYIQERCMVKCRDTPCGCPAGGCLLAGVRFAVVRHVIVRRAVTRWVVVRDTLEWLAVAQPWFLQT